MLDLSEDIQVPAETKEFSINMSNMRHWERPGARYIDECLTGEGGPRGKNFNMRWIASMVADVHRILIRGGVFMYPWDKREPGKPGKLRLMYEANPMSLLVEQAGGKSFDGSQAILDIQPTGLHQRVSVMLGSKEEVERLGCCTRRSDLSDRELLRAAVPPSTSAMLTNGAGASSRASAIPTGIVDGSWPRRSSGRALISVRATLAASQTVAADLDRLRPRRGARRGC